ncbi:MAG TPA: RNA 2',3'-cyclic phosphodiesterase [Gammaproteobacteria bacterium]|nr:RNA 2',3'-cyclic phosphodiesterase [Gammaproteobacteria bacterium]
MSDPLNERPDRHRVFFALWPDDATRAAISRSTREAVRLSGGRPIAKERLHITVAFLGELTAAGVEAARAVPPIPVGPFELTLDAIGVWPESKILWLAPTALPAALAELENLLWDGLVECGFRGAERDYLPHVTLARRARPVESAVEPVRFPVRDLALVESFPDGRNVHYEVLERWDL